METVPRRRGWAVFPVHTPFPCGAGYTAYSDDGDVFGGGHGWAVVEPLFVAQFGSVPDMGKYAMY